MTRFLATLKARHLAGGGGLFAVCSAHPLVMQTAMAMAAAAGQPLLIEATANQVNQYGGYTGMTPRDYAEQVCSLARATGLPAERLIIGADHLGPHLWGQAPLAQAMTEAASLVTACIAAGFQKIHLDTGSGPGAPVAPDIAAERAATLCLAAEKAAAAAQRPDRPFYVIGNDVPPPGGGLNEAETLSLTDPDLLRQTLDCYRQAFSKQGVGSAWERVVAVVVQPGVEFGDRQVAHYRPVLAAGLSAAHAHLPGIMTYEVHATDYQSPQALHRMVDDHFTLLKVGPQLTFAMRRALFALADIEADLPGIEEPSHLKETMERLMLAHPVHWQSHYRGDDGALAYLRRHSLRDRIRYYWSFPAARQTVQRLLTNLKRPIPMALIARHLPAHCAEIEQRDLQTDPEALLALPVRKVLEGYATACWRPQG